MKRPQPLTTKELDQMVAGGCTMPGCDHKHHDSTLYLNQRCHMEAFTQTRYCAKDQVLIVECARCKKEIARVKVANNL